MAVSVAVVFAVRLLQDRGGISLTLFSPPSSGLSAPRIDAVVKAVSHKDKIVLLSVGKDQKVEEGLEFTVYRGPEFIGKVRVIRVYPDLAGAEVIYTKEKAEMQAGDRASTSLPSPRE